VKAALDAAAELKALAAAPVAANFKAELTRSFENTFQKIQDRDIACAMLNQTYVCITDKDRAAAYLDFMKSSGQCSRV
jgi:hypothetical protein